MLITMSEPRGCSVFDKLKQTKNEVYWNIIISR